MYFQKRFIKCLKIHFFCDSLEKPSLDFAETYLFLILEVCSLKRNHFHLANYFLRLSAHSGTVCQVYHYLFLTFILIHSIYLHDNVDPSNILLWIYSSIYMPKFMQASQNTLDKKCVAYYWICHKCVSYQKTQTLSLLLCISPYDWWWHCSTVSLLLYPLLLLQCYIIVIWPEPKHYISY